MTWDEMWQELRRAAETGTRADLRRANLRRADLRRADLRRADLDYASWPLSCGGTRAILDRHLSLQLIYHAVCQLHQDPAIVAALAPLRELAEEFLRDYHPDAAPLPVLEAHNKGDSNAE
jgi:hypothetical protein